MNLVIDPEIVAARTAQAEQAGAFDIMTMASAEARRRLDEASMLFNDGSPDVARVEDRSISGPGGRLRLRVYDPGTKTGGAILYLHGGGWFACSVDTHDRMMRMLAVESGLIVIGVDFRLAPEHPFPAALDDSIAAWDWIQAYAGPLGVEPAKVVIAGDSAGANLALALMVHQRSRRRPLPAGAALAYGCFAPGLSTESSRRFGAGGYGLTDERMQWYWRQYLGDHQQSPPPLAAPLDCDLAGLPPIFLGIAEADTVADDSRLLLERLEQAGVEARLTCWRGTVHGFLQMTRDVESARQAVREMAQWLSGAAIR